MTAKCTIEGCSEDTCMQPNNCQCNVCDACATGTCVADSVARAYTSDKRWKIEIDSKRPSNTKVLYMDKPVGYISGVSVNVDANDAMASVTLEILMLDVELKTV